MKPRVFHPEAAEEYLEAIEFYAAIESHLGGRFYDEMEGIIQTVTDDPKRFPRFSPPARRALSQDFPYSVIYLDEPDRIWIVAVMHGKRRPGYWRQRMS